MTRDLQNLAVQYGLQTAYSDVTGKRRLASQETLTRALQILGAPLERPGDAAAMLAMQSDRKQADRLPPVVVAWNGRLAPVPVRGADRASSAPWVVTVIEENGQEHSWRHHPADLKVKRHGAHTDPEVDRDVASAGGAAEAIGSARRADPVWLVPIPVRLPLGYHRLQIDLDGVHGEALIISAPRRLKDIAANGRQWGVFTPIYSVRRAGDGAPGSSGDWGAGSVGEFGEFCHWIRDLGGTLVASLPLLASFYDHPGDVSPYAPASRLFWNEFFVDVTRAPEFEQCEEARRMVESSDFQREIAALRAQPTVDYMPLMRLKRSVLEVLAKRFFKEPEHRRQAFEEMRWNNADFDMYARFRAACERLGRPWTRWPHPLRDGNLPDEPADESAKRYYMYAQWLAHEQLGALAQSARDAGMVWYLDLPLGTHPDGYDVWRYQDVFALGAAGGAPPDACFTKGQNWGFPPLHPRRLRERRYDYLIRVIRHHLGQARLLRIDHVMGLHRLYWVPDGFPASEGVYVRYPAEEYYAILLLEAHRHNAAIIGENLGTVPAYVNRDMRRHGLGRLYVLQYELAGLKDGASLRPPDPDEVASLNTHDMPTFATWWGGKDIDDRMDLGLMDAAGAEAEREYREVLKRRLLEVFREQRLLDGETPDVLTVLRACLAWLGASNAGVVLVQLEDLWLERDAQNTPGTVAERINWRRKARHTLEELRHQAEFSDTLSEIDRHRRQAR